MTLSAGWIVVVTLVRQKLTTRRVLPQPTAELSQRAASVRQRVRAFRDGLNRGADSRLVAAAYTCDLDDQSLNNIRVHGGVLEVTTDISNDPQRAANFVDEAVKKLGIDYVGLSASLYDRAGYDITLELLRRGYREEDLFKLLGGNAERVMSSPQPAP
jgi:hypothetical protein